MSAHDSAILIIEHDPMVQQLYIRTLQQDYTVLVCNEVRQCRDYLQRDDVHAVIIEPHRPDGQGGQFLNAITTQMIQRVVPIIICSVLDMHRHVLTHDISKHLIKPVAPEVLRTLLTQLIVTNDSI